MLEALDRWPSFSVTDAHINIFLGMTLQGVTASARAA